ncbi:uncharacterized protein TEOVI_000683400 [Trypanosoma equiperdum]|uniref:Uncharacterized protein n=2 Tax=Trypanozoon TaxID=39700 RepID=Q586T8_TRYB2|nr:hypothetical protein, conserved [Trypanosoma brucei brucei TREU927]AAQ15958.1 hypothetical protein, conserved [Trypanosoma brucei brucei TREU927]AAX80149.1 hypothetical protein, conserved [Trypanosoma brucei]SCU65375.1 hypothetical protein, conserved [Trypanosoma equiperdum]
MATRGVAPPPPVVRVPLLEPTPTSVTAARSLWGKPPALPSTGSILTDHYQTAHPGRVLESVACAETAILDSAARMAHIEELLRSVHKHCDAPTRETAAVAGALPQSECTKAKCRTPIGTSLEQREDQRHRGKGLRPPSPRPPRRDESPAKPGWNRRTPTPRKKPVVSDPVTEPRRVTRSSSADNPRRPQQEGLKRVGSTGSDAHTQRVSGKSYAAPSESVRRPSNRSAPSNSRASSVVVSLARKAEGTTTLDSVGREPSVIDSRLDFMQSALRDAQERATRAEARCEELEVAFHALKLQHDEATTRLEERQSQLVAQVQYLLQWVRQLEEAILVKGEVLLTKTECVDGAGVARGSQNRCVTEEANSGSLLAPGGTRGKPVHQETGAKGVTLRVPPTPPMALRLQHK